MPTYRIIGAYEETGSAVTLEVEAADEGKAALIAERRRVLVQRIELVGKAPAVEPVSERPVERPRPKIRGGRFLWGAVSVDSREGYKWPQAGEVRRKTQGAEYTVAPEELRLSDIVYARGGHAYLKLDYTRLFWTIVWGFVIGNFMLWITLLVLGVMLVGGSLASAVGGAAAAREAMRPSNTSHGSDGTDGSR